MKKSEHQEECFFFTRTPTHTTAVWSQESIFGSQDAVAQDAELAASEELAALDFPHGDSGIETSDCDL